MRLFFLMLTLVITGAVSVNAQVLIGDRASGNPHDGAILDLAPPSGQSLGLLLPNVQLSNDANAFSLGSNVDGDQISAARGMIVYNTANVLDGRGLYVWDGNKWTSLGFACPRSITDERDGNVYFVGDFGAAGCWMTENLRYIPDTEDGYSHNGTSFDKTSEEKCYVFPRMVGDNTTYPKTELDNVRDTWQNTPKLKETGVFYNWPAAVNMGTRDNEHPNTTANEGENYTDGPKKVVRGVCPPNWHIPSDREWNDLEKEITEAAQGMYSEKEATKWSDIWRISDRDDRGTTHGNKMKCKRRFFHINPDQYSFSNAADAGGFNALLIGRVYGASFDVDRRACFWSSSSYSSELAWARKLHQELGGVWRSDEARSQLFSVRCKKDKN
jgi:uncharacterized protein (TIGR02145 family)